MLHKKSPWIPILIVIGLYLAIQNWWRVDLLLRPIEYSGLIESDVRLYTTSWCPYCKKARRFLQQANIPFTEYDVEKSSQAYTDYQRISGRGVPVVRIGDMIIQGYNPTAMRSALNTLSDANAH